MHVLRHEQSQHAVAGDSCGCWNNKAETLKKACFRGYPKSTICVQVSVGSRNPAIHNAYRTSLRPSSLFEPRHPSLKVVSSEKAHAARDRRWYTSIAVRRSALGEARHGRGNERTRAGVSRPTARGNQHEGRSRDRILTQAPTEQFT